VLPPVGLLVPSAALLVPAVRRLHRTALAALCGFCVAVGAVVQAVVLAPATG
jgi:hypothetical protein